MTQLKTEADYMRLPEGTPIQLIRGEFIMSPSPITAHQRLQMRLAGTMYAIVSARSLGEVFTAPMDVHLSDLDVYQPDVLFVSNERASVIQEKGIFGAPDFVIEILSPSTAGYDLIAKKDCYEKFGVAEYWIVDPKHKTLECFVKGATGFESSFLGREGAQCSSVLPEFCVDVAKLFA